MVKEKTSYSDEELQEFKELIEKKLEKARQNYNALLEAATSYGNDINDTSPTFALLQDSAGNLSRTECGINAERILKFIKSLEAALVRIETKRYGICRVTGKLIPKERLRAVPHTTMCIEAKLSEKK